MTKPELYRTLYSTVVFLGRGAVRTIRGLKGSFFRTRNFVYCFPHNKYFSFILHGIFLCMPVKSLLFLWTRRGRKDSSFTPFNWTSRLRLSSALPCCTPPTFCLIAHTDAVAIIAVPLTTKQVPLKPNKSVKIRQLGRGATTGEKIPMCRRYA